MSYVRHSQTKSKDLNIFYSLVEGDFLEVILYRDIF